jgi:hypothetical protein
LIFAGEKLAEHPELLELLLEELLELAPDELLLGAELLDGLLLDELLEGDEELLDELPPDEELLGVPEELLLGDPPLEELGSGIVASLTVTATAAEARRQIRVGECHLESVRCTCQGVFEISLSQPGRR